MSCALTIASGVHVGARSDASAFIDWFAATPTTRFTSITALATPRFAGAQTGWQAITGHALLRGRPITFEINRLTRDVLTDSLGAIAIEGMMGQPRTTLSGFRDVVARAGELVNVSWSERRNDGGAAETFSVWGVLDITDASVRGTNETLRCVLYPCDALNWLGTANWFLTPTAYASLAAS